MDIFDMYQGHLLQSPQIDDWAKVQSEGVTAVVALNAIDPGVPGAANEWLYTYWPINDVLQLPSLFMLNRVTNLIIDLVLNTHVVLVHCAAGINRASLVNGVVLAKLGVARGPALVDYIRQHRPGALGNPVFADYLAGYTPSASVVQ